MMSVFLGQVTGSSAGSIVYLHYGPRASYGMSVGFSLCGIFILLIRGPTSTKNQWIGWNGVWSLRKEVVLKARERLVEKEEEEEKEKEKNKKETTEMEAEQDMTTIKSEVEEAKEEATVVSLDISDLEKKKKELEV